MRKATIENYFSNKIKFNNAITFAEVAERCGYKEPSLRNKFSKHNLNLNDIITMAGIFGYKLALISSPDDPANTVIEYIFQPEDYDDPEGIQLPEGKTVSTVSEYVSEPRPIKMINGEKAELNKIEIPADAITYFHVWQAGKWFMFQVEGDKDRIKEAARFIRQSDKGNTEKELEDLAVTASIMFDVTVSVRKPDQHMIELLNSRGYETVEKTTDALLQD